MRVAIASASCRSRRPTIIRPRDTASRWGSVMFSVIERPMSRPCVFRLSGTSAIPLLTAAFGDRSVTGSPFSFTTPPVRGSAAKIARATSDLPLPTRPASPRISPARISSETSDRNPLVESRST